MERVLATPTDLKPNKTKPVVECLNHLIADAFALYVKTKNFHWHVSGEHFRDYHLLFDEQAEAILESIDPMAERVRKISGGTIRSISHISQLQTLQDDNDDYVPAQEMLQRLLSDNRSMAEALRQGSNIAEKSEDVATANLLQEILDQTERRIWFLFETTQGDNENRFERAARDGKKSA